jgi:succinoglycan biosynthesis protein ExoA
MRPDEDLLIVIPTLDEQRRIVEVIETLRSDPACARALIVVADGGSKDRTLALVKELASKDENLEMIDASPRGIPGGINLAVRMFGGSRKLLVRIDAHAQYPKHYVSRLINTLLAERADLVVVRMRAQGETCFEMAAATAQNTFLGTGGAPHRIGARSGWVDHGHHALFLLGKFMGIGGYDEFFDNKKLRSAEDVDFDARLWDSGGRIWLANDIEVTYFPRSSSLALLKQYYAYGYGRGMMFKRHLSRIKSRHLILPVIAPTVALSALGATLWWPLVLPAIAWSSTCLLCGSLATSSKGWCARFSGVPAAIMQFGWSAGFLVAVLSMDEPPQIPIPLKFGRD